MNSFDVLRELVNDIEGAFPSDYDNLDQYDSEVDEERLDWPDLMVTYHHAKNVLARHEKESG